MMDNGKSGVICSDNWGIYEAMVVCRQNGKQQAERATLVGLYLTCCCEWLQNKWAIKTWLMCGPATATYKKQDQNDF